VVIAATQEGVEGCAKWVRDPSLLVGYNLVDEAGRVVQYLCVSQAEGLVHWPEGLGVSRRVFGSKNRT
jgi:hypothetical protein